MNNNPLVQDTNFISKIKTKLKKKEDNEIAQPTLGSIEIDLVGMNNAIPICAEACSCCWDKTIPEGYDNVAEYVAKRTRIGHTSVIEHSNFIILISTPRKYEDELLSILDITNYLYTKTIISEDGQTFYTLMGGSYRGYNDLYRETDDLKNPVLLAITNILYTYAHSAAFEDLGKLHLMDMRGFMDTEPDENYKLLTDYDAMNDKSSNNDLFKIIGIDSINKLYTNIYNINKYVASKLTFYDMIKFTTVTVLFKDMSRTCTHQLVRHRNAITQESQRYVDYSSACFSSPVAFKPDRYNPDHKYTIQFGTGPNQKMTLDELGDELCKIYGQLHNSHYTGKGFELLKEDARAYLPGNVQCKKIYVTFTFKNLLKFLNLREDNAAQAEIRMYANALGEFIRHNTEFHTKELCDTMTLPRLLIEDPFKIDIDEGEVEEVKDITEKDYIDSYGFDSNESNNSTTNTVENGGNV